MNNDIIKNLTDMTCLKWIESSSSSSSGGSLLKASEIVDGKRIFYKMSSYDSQHGVYGYECINEIIVSRLLDILNFDHVKYELINAKVKVDGKEINTYICRSNDFKKENERKETFEAYYNINKLENENVVDFINRKNEKYFFDFFDTMYFIDYLILNRDRHAKNVEIIYENDRMRFAPLFDHGLSLLLESYENKEYVDDFNVLLDRSVNNFFGTKSTMENLKYIKNRKRFENLNIDEKDYEYIFKDINDIIPDFTISKIRKMLYERLNLWKSSI